MEVRRLLLLWLAVAQGAERLRSAGRSLQDASENDTVSVPPTVCAAKPAVSFVDQKPMCQNCASITIDDPVKRCMFNTSQCENVGPGQSCEIDCALPFVRVGNVTTGQCATGNSIPDRMIVWQEPMCICPEPASQQGYVKEGNVWRCSQGFAGTPQVVCEPLPGCQGVQSFLQGYDLYGCSSVLPGNDCEVRCQVPFAGTVTIGSCLSGNTDVNGLVWTAPSCSISSCEDPMPGNGYQKVDGAWECSAGYSGSVTKTCQWMEDACEAYPVLSGCVQEQPCRLPDMANPCMFDTADCMNVQPGKMCSIRCKSPYLGPATDFTCPVANTDPNTALLGTLPDCGCGEPTPLPPGYNLTSDQFENTITYSCAQGYGGTARKLCQPGPGPECTVDPLMTGCAIPLACEVIFIDQGSGEGTAIGEIHMGPALLGASVDEADVLAYEVFWADSCEERLGTAALGGIAAGRGDACCRNDVYQVPIRSRPPESATGFVVFSVLSVGRAPVGVYVELNRTLLTRAIIGSNSHVLCPVWALWLLLALRW
ncbi:unnamed protein product [Effrenium voratum]|nr:unnamed protein product [Effrenium voratum]